jgi:hypothetical protein
MRHDTRVKLDRQIKLRKLKFIGLGLAALLAFAGGLLLVDLDTHETKTRVAGTVERVSTPAPKGAMDDLDVGVKQDDGRHVRVLPQRSREPNVGDHIQVTEYRHLAGRTTFSYH